MNDRSHLPQNASIDFTHDTQRRSWVESANDPNTEFPLQNLPLGSFRPSTSKAPRVGIAIGDRVLDLAACDELGLLTGDAQLAAQAGAAGRLNGIMALGRPIARELRRQLSRLLESGSAAAAHAERILYPMDKVELLLPVEVGDFTDFYTSVHHATNVGSMFRPDNPLLPNFKWIPIGYHSRASSVVISGSEVRRPWGQTILQDENKPVYRPARLLDYELEVGFFVSEGNDLGDRVDLDGAEDRIFGMCLVNDWSARDIQKWEYQPLGPFLSKSFATTVSPWVVTMDALAPFRCSSFQREESDPQPLPHLDSENNRIFGGVDLQLEVYLSTTIMREKGIDPHRLSLGNARDLYWTIAQMLTHHASNGCNLRTGDLLASGTVSGPEKSSRGCLLELTWRGSEPLTLPSGEERKFLQDGDEVILRGRCEAEEFVSIGFGECRGIVLPAHEDEHR